jgi:hypothetical protein
LAGTSSLFPNKVYLSLEKVKGKAALRIEKDSTVKDVDEPTFVKIKSQPFFNGIIEAEVLSRLLPTAPVTARGFIGLAFRINNDNTKFECIYIRPTNGRADDQVRRNHSIQYFCYPDFKFDRLRRESPEKYEAYADMGLNEWIKVKIIVNNTSAKLFINNCDEPSLIVNDLRHGNSNGAIGMFVDVGTEGFFRNIKITNQ